MQDWLADDVLEKHHIHGGESTGAGDDDAPRDFSERDLVGAGSDGIHHVHQHIH